jgi:hypothetical protein
LEHADNIGIADIFAEAYAVVAQKLQDQNAIEAEAEALRGQLEHARDTARADVFAGAYAAVAQKLQGQNAIKIAAEALGGAWDSERTAHAYVAVAQKLQDKNAIKTKTEMLRGQMEHAQDDRSAGDVAGVYAEVAQMLQDQNAINTAAEALRGQLERAQDENSAGDIANAFAGVARRWLEIHRGDRQWEMQISQRILAAAGQPFLENPTALLATLEPLAERQFGNDVGAAVAWWVDRYKASAALLRPPLPSLP